MCVYGLVDVSRQWYRRVEFELSNYGFEKSEEDPCVFVETSGSIRCLISVHVDDFWICGEDREVDHIVAELKTLFVAGTVTDLPATYLGVQIAKSGGAVECNPDTYRQEMTELKLESARRNANSPLDPEERSVLRALLGKTLWHAMQVRPDICHKVSLLMA